VSGERVAVCKDCTTWLRLMKSWRVGPGFLADMVRAGHLKTHEHGPRTTITKESIQDCQWRIALAKAGMEEEVS
jgi:hypothetical protein